MDKIVVNNKIISMRKFVKQARIRIINKLAKDVRALKSKNGTDLQLKKYERKCERIIAEIEYLKKLSVDTISKMALLKEKDYQAILCNKASSINDRAFALVVQCDAVQAEVNKFHENYAYLVPHLSEFIESWEAKKINVEKSYSKTMKASEFKQKRKEIFRNRHSRPSVKSLSSSNVSTICHSSGLQKSAIDSCQMNANNSSSERAGEAAEVKFDLISSEDNDDNKRKLSEIINEGKRKTNESTIVPFDEQFFMQEKKVESGFDVSCDEGFGNETITRKSKDSFFITENETISDSEGIDCMEGNSRMLSSKAFNDIKKSKQNLQCERNNWPSKVSSHRNFHSRKLESGKKLMHKKSNTTFGTQFSRDKFIKRQDIQSKNVTRGHEFKGQPFQKRFPQEREARKSFKQSYRNDKETNFQQRSGVKQQKNFGPKCSQNDSKLHPSWEAKRKMKSQMTISAFQGTKIKFDD